MYRFVGIHDRIQCVNDVITSLACEWCGDDTYQNDPVSALIYLKQALEDNEDSLLVVLAGIQPDTVLEYLNVLNGLKITKLLLVLETDDPNALPSYLEYTDSDFETLVRYLLAQKAKSLSETQLQRILQYGHGDYLRVKLLITYLCTFASYETLEKTLDELVKLPHIALTDKYLKQLMQVQDRHHPSGIMRDVLELLCHSPLPLTREDIVETILWSRKQAAINENGEIIYTGKDEIAREVSFSLAFARDYIEEYDSRLKIHDDTVQRLMMFQEASKTMQTAGLRLKKSVLIIALRSIYFHRFYNQQIVDAYDARNFCEIIKYYSDPETRRLFLATIAQDRKNLYKWVKALGKKDLVDLFKTLIMQSMDAEVKSYFTKTLEKHCHIPIEIGSARGIIGEKLFSVFRANHPDNKFGQYYTAMIGLKEDDLTSFEAFAAAIDKTLQDETLPYYTLPLSSKLHVHNGNTTCYTSYDIHINAYATHYCCCDHGFAFVGDVYSGEMVSAYAIPRNAGKIIATFYQNRTLHIVFEDGIITTINVVNHDVNSYRCTNPGEQFTQLTHYQNNRQQIAVINGDRVWIMHAMIRKRCIEFAKDKEILFAYGVPINDNAFEAIVVIGRNQNGTIFYSLVDPEQGTVRSIFTLYDTQIRNIAQNPNNGDIFLTTNGEDSLLLQYNKTSGLEMDLDDSQMNVFGGSHRVCKINGVVYCDDQPVPGADSFAAAFVTRKMYGFITDENIIYCFDNGY